MEHTIPEEIHRKRTKEISRRKLCSKARRKEKEANRRDNRAGSRRAAARICCGKALNGWRHSNLKQAAITAQDEHDGTPRKGIAIQDTKTQPCSMLPIQCRFRRR